MRGSDQEESWLPTPIGQRYHVFVSYAREDQATAVDLKTLIEARGLQVWLDQEQMTVGDDVAGSIERGLERSRFGIVLLSERYFAKAWPQRELEALLGRDTAERKVVLPLLHGIDHAYVEERSPALARKVQLDTRQGLVATAEAVLRAVVSAFGDEDLVLPAPPPNIERVLAVAAAEDLPALGRERGFGEALQRAHLHHMLARHLARQHDGRLRSRSLGTYVVVFDKPDKALAFALEYVRRAQERAELARVGLALHAVQLAPKAVEESLADYGGALDATVRLAHAATPGRIVMTSEIRRRTAHAQGATGELRWEHLGLYEAEGLAEELQLFEVSAGTHLPVEPLAGPGLRRAGAADEPDPDWKPAAGLEVPRRPGCVLEESLGEGSFGAVWLAEIAGLGEKRVLKFPCHPELVSTLRQERRILQALRDHLSPRTDIAKLTSSQLEAPPYYLEYEFAEGGSLADWAKRHGGLGEIPLETRLDVAAQVARALAAAHSIGVIHNDLKPTNVLIARPEAESPRILLTDFGLGEICDVEVYRSLGPGHEAGEQHGSGSGSSSGAHGTQRYMAPEYLAGEIARPDQRSDIYSLGQLLYQLAVGRLDVWAEGEGWARDVESEVALELIRACVDRDPQRRVFGADQVAHALETRHERERVRRAERFALFAIAAQAFFARIDRERRRKRRAQAGAALLFGGVVAGALLSFLEARAERQRADATARSIAGLVVESLTKNIGAAMRSVRWLADRTDVVALVAERPFAADDAELDGRIAAHQATAAAFNAEGFLQSWFVIDVGGHLRGRFPAPSPAAKEALYSDRDYFRNCKDGGYASSPYFASTHPHAVSLAFSTPVVSAAGERIAVAACTFSSRQVDDSIRAFVDEDARAYRIAIVNDDGRVIHHPANPLRSEFEQRFAPYVPDGGDRCRIPEAELASLIGLEAPSWDDLAAQLATFPDGAVIDLADPFAAKTYPTAHAAIPELGWHVLVQQPARRGVFASWLGFERASLWVTLGALATWLLLFLLPQLRERTGAAEAQP